MDRELIEDLHTLFHYGINDDCVISPEADAIIVKILERALKNGTNEPAKPMPGQVSIEELI